MSQNAEIHSGARSEKNKAKTRTKRKELRRGFAVSVGEMLPQYGSYGEQLFPTVKKKLVALSLAFVTFFRSFLLRLCSREDGLRRRLVGAVINDRR